LILRAQPAPRLPQLGPRTEERDTFTRLLGLLFEGRLKGCAVNELWQQAARSAYSFQIELSKDGREALGAAQEQRAQVESPHPPLKLIAAVVAAPVGGARLGRLQTAGAAIVYRESLSVSIAPAGDGGMYDFMAPLRDLRERVRANVIEHARLDEIGRLQARAEDEAARARSRRAQLYLIPGLGVNETSPPTDRQATRPDTQSNAASSWWDAAGPYIAETQRGGRFSTAKELYRALVSAVGSPGSPFLLGNGAHRGELMVARINRPLALKTLQNNWGRIKAAAS
jgi:hypothetical protein